MKRSEINDILESAVAFCRQQNFHLPRWATWTLKQWRQAGHQADEIRKRGLGWDVTDFGNDNFPKLGLTLFTIRNGELGERPDVFVKDYCEKLLLIAEEQVTPTHFHWSKMEDIINRAGGRLVLRLWNADPKTEQRIEAADVTVSIDGIEQIFAAGEPIVLDPGESITLPPYMYHLFYAEGGSGMVLAGEVSRVNDDANDNRFLDPLPRFPDIEEDEEPLHLLCTEYPPAQEK